MKKISNSATRFVAMCTLLFVLSCSVDDGVEGVPLPDEFTVTQIVNFSGALNLLEEALILTGLDATLDGSGEFTLFAPSDAAFEALLDGAELTDVPVEDLTQLLLNHVVAGSITSSDLATLGSGYVDTFSTAGPEENNLSLFFNATDGVVVNGGSANGGASVVDGLADSMATNGVVHIVDAVIGLPNIVTFALADPNLSTLVTALTADGLTNDFVAILSAPPAGSAFSTVFAPTNMAFGDLLTELDVMALGDIPVATLEAVLTYHVSQPFNVRAEDLVDDQIVSTLNGDTFTVNLPAGADPTITDVNMRVTNIIVINIQATNGVIHAVDQVLLPTLN